MTNTRLIQLTALCAVAAVYFAVRFLNMTASCLWFDEIFSVHAASQEWGPMLTFVARDLIHPPLFYALLKLWTGIGGESLFWYRLLPAVFSCLAIFPFLLITKELKLDFWQRFIALFLFAVNGSMIKYAQEVRMYSLLLFLSLTSVWVFTRYFKKGKSFYFLIVVNILLVYSHYFGWLVIGSQLLAIILYQRIKIRAMLIVAGAAFIAFLPWAIAVWNYARAGAEVGQNIGWMQRPTLFHIAQIVVGLVEPFYFQSSTIESYSSYRVSLPLLAIAITGITFLIVRWKHIDEGGRQPVKLFLIFALFPLLIAFLASWLLPYSVWGTRHLIVIFAPVSILLAIGVTSINVNAVRIAAVSLILLFAGYGFVLSLQRETAQYSWCAWEPLTVGTDMPADATIYAGEDLVAYHLWFASRSTPGRKIGRLTDLRGVTEDKAYFLPRGFDEIPVMSKEALTEKRFWIAYRTRRRDHEVEFLNDFRSAGYRVAGMTEREALGERAVIVEIVKED